VIYAPYGAYLPGGSLWHSQANESALAHYPGLSIAVPSTPEDAAGLLWTAMHAEDPVIFLIPKHLLWAEHEYAEPIRAVPFGQARKCREGSDVTLVAWGNTMEKSLEAIAKLDSDVSVELIDLRSIIPWDRAAIEESVQKTRRLVVVQEDTENCSVGQMIISHVTGKPELWNEMISPPILVSKTNVVIGYNPIYEYAALPDAERILAAIKRSVATKQERDVGAAGVDRGRAILEPAFAEPRSTIPTAAEIGKGRAQSITVPIMGEGIRNAKIVSLLKKPGDSIAMDDELCEVETDKAVYPIQSSFAGVMGEWKTKVGDTVEIGQELGTIFTGEPSFAEQFQPAAKTSPDGGAVAADTERGRWIPQRDLTQPGSPPPATAIEPALSPTITRKLSRVIPANLQIDARWDAIQKARDAAKKKAGNNAPSPSVMIAWAVVRAMEKHAPFRRLILEDDEIIQNEDFDLGVAVALESDRLATAVITQANKKSWPEFVRIYNETVEATRGGRVDAMNAPVVITSLGAFGVRAGAPIVVPPSVGTLFVGTAHRELIPNKNQNQSAEVITLSLTFDHRVVNGAGAASFANEIKKQIERFKIPAAKADAIST
jgi:2-oxoisovalerate dehydrogenase E1 component